MALWSERMFSLEIAKLQRTYDTGESTPLDIIEQVYAHIAQAAAAGVFISEVDRQTARAAATEVMQRRQAGEQLPLYGVPFAVKDNIDVAGLPTTAACPAFSYVPERSATVVAKLTQLGAIVIGKTNLDQFATGLVGVRSPYDVPENPLSPKHVPGGSSSGSAVAVARGFVSFALGTDTAGSGRVPAGFNNIVGLKPTRGMLSTHGLVPACRSLDCVSVFALNVADATLVAQLMAGFDAHDPYARADADRFDPRPSPTPPQFRFGVPNSEHLVLPDAAAQQAYARALTDVAALGGSRSELSFALFSDTAALLYDGPWVAERLEAAGALLKETPDALLPVLRTILSKAAGYRALDAFKAQAQLASLRRQCQALFRNVDLLVVPTAPIFPTVAQVHADPIGVNMELGRYTNFVNLLDLCALAVPAGFRTDGLPFGVTLIARAGHDALLASVGQALHARLNERVGALPEPWQGNLPSAPARPSAGRTWLAVCGAHLSGQPLNRELTELGARFVRAAHTASCYLLYALDTTPEKPGLVRAVEPGDGERIELEVWELDVADFGAFVSRIPSPLGIGTIELEDGVQVQGFLCEYARVQGARDITAYGGWRAYLKSRVA
jgi:allophanate hydrolase